jgi:NAD(P)-dependent dehydrogenase (short-subunit alcohol dehydrogenase family)
MNASTFIDAPDLDAARVERETNYFGTLNMCRAFAPVLAANGGGAIINMLSVTSFYSNPLDASYGASKAAAWSLTNGIRVELAHQGTLVVAVHARFIDADTAAGIDTAKLNDDGTHRTTPAEAPASHADSLRVAWSLRLRQKDATRFPTICLGQKESSCSVSRRHSTESGVYRRG